MANFEKKESLKGCFQYVTDYITFCVECVIPTRTQMGYTLTPTNTFLQTNHPHSHTAWDHRGAALSLAKANYEGLKKHLKKPEVFPLTSQNSSDTNLMGSDSICGKQAQYMKPLPTIYRAQRILCWGPEARHLRTLSDVFWPHLDWSELFWQDEESTLYNRLTQIWILMNLIVLDYIGLQLMGL